MPRLCGTRDADLNAHFCAASIPVAFSVLPLRDFRQVVSALRNPTDAMMNRPGLALFTLVLSLLVGAQLAGQDSPFTPPQFNSTGGRSPHETTSTIIGERNNGNRVTITYGRPFRRSPANGEIRKIWGALVPWEKPWRLGADEATLLLTQKPLLFGGTEIPAGAHTLYLVPSENGESLLAFSTSLGQWGVPVDTKHDLARVPAARQPLAATVEQLTITVENDQTAGGGVIDISWENTRFSLPFTVKK